MCLPIDIRRLLMNILNCLRHKLDIYIYIYIYIYIKKLQDYNDNYLYTLLILLMNFAI